MPMGLYRVADAHERGDGAQGRGRFAWAFLRAAASYWLIVFPGVCREVRRLRRRAGQTPDPVLRRLALDALEKRGNIEGAAAFAAFVPSRHRRDAVRALVAFQSAYNYLDILAEQPSPDPVGNGRRLHEALLVALDPAAARLDHYEYCPWREDGGYLGEMIDECREALGRLPSHAAVLTVSRRFAERIVAFQSLHLSRAQGDHDGLARWAEQLTPAGTQLEWWETAASGGSSLGVFALIALAAEPVVAPGEVAALENAYFPWIGALHSLMDNLVDRSEDDASGQRSLVDYYASAEDAAARMKRLASESMSAAQALRGGTRHTLVLTAMASFYLSMPEACEPDILPVSRALLEVMGGFARPALATFQARRRLACLLGAGPAESRAEGQAGASRHRSWRGVRTGESTRPVIAVGSAADSPRGGWGRMT
jgi:tetraprenyl-beta-curcumene synthase